MIPPKDLLKRVVPFSYLSEKELEELVSSMDVEVYEAGERILKKGKIPKYVFFVYSGELSLKKGSEEERITKGEIFGVSAAIEKKPVEGDLYAAEDSVCYLFKADVFKKLVEENERFGEFFRFFKERKFSSLRFSYVTLEDALLKPVKEIVRRNPVTCSRDTKVKEAAEKMFENRIGSLVVVEDEKPLGIFTDRDLKKAVSLDKVDERVEKFMSSPVISDEATSPIFEAYIKMLESGINHLVVTENGKISGVISIKDVLSAFEPLSRVTYLFRSLRRSESVDEVKEIVAESREIVKELTHRGVSFQDISRTLNAFYDVVYEKVFEFLGEETDREFSFVVMGSGGRKEQIIATDQDNAMITEIKSYKFENVSKRAVELLDYVGIPKCKAGYMAPNWCMSIDEWKRTFKNWFTNLTPQNVRHLTIFLDMRHVYGNEDLYNELRDYVFEAKTNQAVRFLAKDALTITPPIGFFGMKNLEKGIDLKLYGIYPIVNCARVLTLDAGIKELNTIERLRAVKELIGEERCETLVEVYNYIQNLRLRHQAHESDNIVNAKELEKLDVVLLRESFKVIKNFQDFIKAHYGVERI